MIRNKYFSPDVEKPGAGSDLIVKGALTVR